MTEHSEKLLACGHCGDPMRNDGETFGHTDSSLPCILAKHAWAAAPRFIAAWNTRSDTALAEALARVKVLREVVEEARYIIAANLPNGERRLLDKIAALKGTDA